MQICTSDQQSIKTWGVQSCGFSIHCKRLRSASEILWEALRSVHGRLSKNVARWFEVIIEVVRAPPPKNMTWSYLGY